MVGFTNAISKIVEDEKVNLNFADCKSKVVCVPQENDVLLGRGGRARDHEGNVYFRSLVSDNKKHYQNERLRFDRRYIAVNVYRAVKERNGRFLRKMKNEQWYEVTKKTAVDKTAQALREKYTNVDDMKRPAFISLAFFDEMTNALHKESLMPSTPVNLSNAAKSMQLKPADNNAGDSSIPLKERNMKPGQGNCFSRENSKQPIFDLAAHSRMDPNKSSQKVERLLTRHASRNILNQDPQKVSRNLATKVEDYLSQAVENNIFDSKFNCSCDEINFYGSRIMCQFSHELDTSIPVKVVSDTIKSNIVHRIIDKDTSGANTKKTLINQASFDDKIVCQITASISYIGQFYLDSSCKTESKDIFELIANLNDKGEQGSLYLPIVVAQLCKRVKDLET